MKELAFLVVGFGLGLYCARTKASADKSRLESEISALRAAAECRRQQEQEKK